MAEKSVSSSGSETDLLKAHPHTRRLHRLTHPKNGKIYHIVSGPHEVDEKRHAVLKEDPNCDAFEVLIQGTNEFVSLLREIQTHHEAERESLLQEHPETLTKYENVKKELDVLNTEMRHMTEHAVALDANFDKFGYSARVRSKGDSETASLETDESGSQISKYDDRSLEPIKFISQPVLKQYFHKGLLWRSPRASEVASFELFVDLVYVVVIDYIGYAAVLYNPSAASFLHYVIVFAISWKVYCNIAMTLNMFEIDDVALRMSILFVLCCLYGFATNVLYFFQYTYTAGLAFYIAIQMFFVIFFFWIGMTTKMVRGVMVYHSFLTVVSAAIWIASIHVPYPRNLGLIFVGIFIDIMCPPMIMPILRPLAAKHPNWKRLQAFLEYTPAINIEHRVERTNAFTSLVFGYSVLTIIFQNRAPYPLTAFLGKGMLALVQSFIFNWIYFEMDGSNLHVHAIRRHWGSAITWSIAHMPFAGGYILAAASLAKLVFARDHGNTDLNTLAYDYRTYSYDYVEPAIPWFYCGGLGVSLISMATISFCHIHKKVNDPRIRKRPRLVARVAIAIVIICLPLARMNSLHLMSTTTGLVAVALILDIFGMSRPGERFFTGGFCPEHKRKKTYTARCKMSRRQRQEMQRKLAAGHKLTLDDALRRDSVSSMESGLETPEYHGHMP